MLCCVYIRGIVLFIWLLLQVDIEAFRCNNGNNIDDMKTCDQNNDCGDKSDEINCGEKFDSENCTLDQGKYLCHDRSKCLHYKYICNNQCDCDDCSDENDTRCIECDCNDCNYVFHPEFPKRNTKCDKYASFSCNSCQHDCWPTPVGFQCVCNTNHSESSSSCKISNEVLVFYSTPSKIKSVNFAKDEKQIQTIKTNVNCTALAAALGNLYYANFQNNKASIYKIVIDSGKTVKIFQTDSEITCLAVDWLTANIYFASNRSLFVCTDNGDKCLQLENYDTDYFVLAPKFGWIFYTEKSTYQNEIIISKSNMDGSEKQTLIDETFQHDVYLSIDEITDTLYWHKMGIRQLQTSSLWGFNRQKNLVPLDMAFFTTFDGKIFYSVQSRHICSQTLVSLPLLRFYHEKCIFDQNTSSIYHLSAYNPFLQHFYQIRNPCEAVSCNGLCLLRSSSLSSTTVGLNYICKREDHIHTNTTPTHTDGVLLGFMLGVVLISSIITVIFIYRKVSQFVNDRRYFKTNDNESIDLPVRDA